MENSCQICENWVDFDFFFVYKTIGKAVRENLLKKSLQVTFCISMMSYISFLGFCQIHCGNHLYEFLAMYPVQTKYRSRILNRGNPYLIIMKGKNDLISHLFFI